MERNALDPHWNCSHINFSRSKSLKVNWNNMPSRRVFTEFSLVFVNLDGAKVIKEPFDYPGGLQKTEVPKKKIWIRNKKSRWEFLALYWRLHPLASPLSSIPTFITSVFNTLPILLISSVKIKLLATLILIMRHQKNKLSYYQPSLRR